MLAASNNNAHVLLHSNTIAKVNRNDRTLKVYDGGWQTKTTKERVNKLLEGTKQGGFVKQEKGQWLYQGRSGKKVPFREGMTFRF